MEDVKSEVEKELGVLKECSFAEKETSIRLNNIKTFKEIVESDDDKKEKSERAEFDKGIRERQVNLEENRFEWDKEKFERQQELDREKMSNAHEERMAELENEKARIENESRRIEEEARQKEKEAEQKEKEFKSQRRRDWLQFGVKCLFIVGTVTVSALLHGAEIRLEQIESGIVPKRCPGYDKAIEGVTNVLIK